MRAGVRQFYNYAFKKAQGHREGFRLTIKHTNFWSTLMVLIYGTETYILKYFWLPQNVEDFLTS
jgi:hypothetical protein